MQWVSTSIPHWAVTSGGTVASTRGSTTVTSGTRPRPMIVILVCRAGSLTMQNWDTSEPLPAVVGMATTGGNGRVARSMPSYSRMWPPFDAKIATPFAASITDPPPSAMIPSPPCRLYFSKAAATSWARGLGEIPVKQSECNPTDTILPDNSSNHGVARIF